MNTDVVILLSAYNGKEYIEQQLESIWKQTYPGKIITLVRDDGSKDETPSIVEAYPQTENRALQLIHRILLCKQKPSARWALLRQYNIDFCNKGIALAFFLKVLFNKL